MCCYSRRKPCSLCCKCVWTHCRPCAIYVFKIRIFLVILSAIDIVIMLWFIYNLFITSDDIQNCCGVVHYPEPEVNSHAMDAYKECIQLNYENLILSDYSNFIFNSKRYHKINWNAFGSILTYYDINITVSPITGACIINHYDCFNDTVSTCIDAQFINNQTFANKTNNALLEMCQQDMS
eukprot:362467_1